MSRVKVTVPNLSTLETRLTEVFKVGIVDFITRTHDRRITVIKNRRYAITAVSVFVISLLALYLAYNYLMGPLLNLVTMYLLGLVVATIITTHRWYKEQKMLAQEMNLALIPIITACFDRLSLYTHDAVHRKETEAILRQAQIVGENFDVMTADDMYSFFDPHPWSLREIELSKHEQSGKNSHYRQIFKGVLIEVTLPNTFNGTTYISTEGDKYGFAHASFWERVNEKDKVKETTLEWNQFEKDLHVATNNEVEARYILTPNFMLTLHDWWAEYKENIRIVFKGNKMFMLLPDHGIKIGTSTTSTDPKELEAYALSVLKPIWRTLMLIEDVRI